MPVFAQAPAEGSKSAILYALDFFSGKAVILCPLSNEGRGLVLVASGAAIPAIKCPYRVRKVRRLPSSMSRIFAAKNTRVLLVYPGPPADLDQHAKEFLEKQADLPANIVLVTDPDYKVTNLYGLRWDAPHETAYPSTFILDKKGFVVFEKISRGHGDRLSAKDALDHLSAQ